MNNYETSFFHLYLHYNTSKFLLIDQKELPLPIVRSASFELKA